MRTAKMKSGKICAPIILNNIKFLKNPLRVTKLIVPHGKPTYGQWYTKMGV